MTESALAIAHEAFSLKEHIVGAVLSTELAITKPNRSRQYQRMNNVYLKTYELIKTNHLDEARQYLLNYKWNTPQTVWWCDDEEGLAKVITDIESMSKRRDRGRSFAYDVHAFPGYSVACVVFWLD